MISSIEDIKDLEDLTGKEIDFFLEDDMFELKGIVRKENNSYSMEIVAAIDHIFKMTGKYLDIRLTHNKVYLRKAGTQKEFEICINRIYNTLNNPGKEEFCTIVGEDIREVIRNGDYQEDDTIVLYDNNAGKWRINAARDGVPRGYSKSYDTLEALYEDNLNEMAGKWEIAYYIGEWG